MSSITKLEVENVKRISAVKIAPDGHVIIGGRNRAGKSSVLDAIEYALGGKGAIPGKPIRDGSKNASITLELGGKKSIRVTREFKEDGKTTLKVVGTDDGRPFPSPQKMLDELYGSLTFDPVAFSRMKPKDQAEALRSAAGVDLTEIDAEILGYVERRKDVNRDLKRLEAQADGFTDSEVPTAEVDIRRLAARRTELLEAKNRRAEVTQRIGVAADKSEACKRELESIRSALNDAELRLRYAEQAEKDGIKELEAHRLADSIDGDIATTTLEIEAATMANAAYEAAATQRAVRKELATVTKQAAEADAAVTKARETKAGMLADLNIPVDGLSLTDAGVEINGVPFEQCSQSEQLDLSTAIGMAANPELKVMLIRDGAYLDEDSLAELCAKAEEAGYQFWIERVGEDEHATVIIEDGTVAEAVSIDDEIGAAIQSLRDGAVAEGGN